MNLTTFFEKTTDDIVVKYPISDEIKMLITKHSHTIFVNQVGEILTMFWGKAVIPSYVEHTSLEWLENRDEAFWKDYRNCWEGTRPNSWKQALLDRKHFKGGF